MSAHDAKHAVDSHTGTATTGHEWDGIKELNTPLPRWWLIVFYATIVWAVLYWVAYPAWPLISSGTQGLLGWHSRAALVSDLGQLQSMRAGMEARIASTPLAEIEKTPDLLSFARAKGAAAFATNCAGCHGAGAQGSRGYPNLNADRWLWGGTLEEIRTTITHGARWDADPKTHSSLMPSFGRDGILKPDEVSSVADFVRTLSGNAPEPGADIEKGRKIFADNCAACHGPAGKGSKDVGAPNLTTQVWLFGPKKADIVERVTNGGGRVMPAWGGRLDDVTIKSLAVFVHSLGGGQ